MSPLRISESYFFLVSGWYWGPVEFIPFAYNSLFWGGGVLHMPPPIPQHLCLWAGFYLISISCKLDPSPVTCVAWWQGFHFLPGGAFSEVRHSIAPPQPHSEIYTWLHLYYYTSYVTWQFFTLIFQFIIVVLSDVIGYHFLSYTLI